LYRPPTELISFFFAEFLVDLLILFCEDVALRRISNVQVIFHDPMHICSGGLKQHSKGATNELEGPLIMKQFSHGLL
jgi:hypothetical protein